MGRMGRGGEWGASSVSHFRLIVFVSLGPVVFLCVLFLSLEDGGWLVSSPADRRGPRWSAPWVQAEFCVTLLPWL